MISIDKILLPKTVCICPICKANFDDYEDCAAHIKTHGKPDEIIMYSERSSQNCPGFIYIKMSDEREACYQFIRILDNKPDEST